MTDDEIWAAIDAHRLRTVELLEQLSDDDWRHPSLCEGWTVRDVAGHLTLQQIGVGTVLRLATRHPGAIARGVNQMIHESAKGRANLSTDQMIADIRGMVGSRRHNIGVTCRETLIDILVHSQDIAIPLGRKLDLDRDAAAVAAARVWSYAGRSKAKVFKKIPFDGLRFTATDTAWSAGSGREIEGPIAAILLVLTGRLAALPMLSGDGAAMLANS